MKGKAMSNTRTPTDRSPASTDAERPSRLRERVRQHMLKMARLALAGAVPLTNTACDCAPSPVCETQDWSSEVSASASWGVDRGSTIVILDLSVRDSKFTVSPSYTITGGSLLTVGKSNQLKIKPDQGATIIDLHGSMSCDYVGPHPLSITIDLVPPDGGNADDYPTVKVSR